MLPVRVELVPSDLFMPPISGIINTQMSNKALELMGDGYARGYPKDTNLMRSQYRTAHGLSHTCDNYSGVENLAKIVCTRYQNESCPELTSYDAYIKETIAMIGAESKKKKPEPKQSIDHAMPDGLEDVLSGIELDF